MALAAEGLVSDDLASIAAIPRFPAPAGALGEADVVSLRLVSPEKMEVGQP